MNAAAMRSLSDRSLVILGIRLAGWQHHLIKGFIRADQAKFRAGALLDGFRAFPQVGNFCPQGFRSDVW